VTIRAVVFDWGGVLTTPPLRAVLELESTFGYAHRQMVDWFFHTRMAPDGSDETPEEDFALLEKAKITAEEFQERVRARSAEHLGVPMGDAEFARLWDLLDVDAGIDAVHWVMIQRVRQLRQEGYRTAICTNQIVGWREFWTSSIPREDFDVIVDSCEVGLRKPEPEIMHLTCDLLGVEPKQALHLDDSLRNVNGARAIGMAAIHVRDPIEAIAELDALLSSEPAQRAGRVAPPSTTSSVPLL